MEANGVKETLCTNCMHRQVCTYKEQFLSVQEAVDNLTVEIGDDSVNVQNVSWLKPIKLDCRHYQYKHTLATRDA